ncbi:MAG TPA: glycosyl hydrolase family 28-related protein [Fimbriimonadaceae bacterium]|nr:glycosyl hydrolase family 28-related protein [Fimbriimonadaceae bacterium]
MDENVPLVDVREFGARPDGKTLATSAIQAAIDRCGSGGGGTVWFSPGTYLSGTVTMRSRVALQLDAGAVLLGSSNKDDFPKRASQTESRTNRYNLRSLIFAENVDRIAIKGQGEINGNGQFYKDRRHDGERPLNLRIINCRDVLIENVTIGNSGFWNQHYLICERVRVHGIKVWNHATYNVDAIDIDSCRDFIVSDCVFDSDDDAVCLKGTLDRPCQNVQITNCVISSHCNAIKMGTDSSGGFQDVAISNCSIVSPRNSKAIYGLQRGISGISLELVDGGRMERIAISNITIDGVETPVFIRLGARGVGMFPTEAEIAAAHHVGTIRDVSISNVIATRAGKTGCAITGIPGHEIENLTLTNMTIRTEGGGDPSLATRAIGELHDKYPEATMFGALPAYGLFCRHVSGLRLNHILLISESLDHRYALVLDDVDDGEVQGLAASTAGPDGPPFAKVVAGRGVTFRGCRPLTPTSAFIEIEGPDCRDVTMIGNDIGHANEPSSFTKGATSDALRLAGNLSRE